jgi:hypothetical protein
MLMQEIAQYISRSFLNQKFFLSQEPRLCQYFYDQVGRTQEEVIDSLNDSLLPSKGVKWHPQQPHAIKTDQSALIKNMVSRGYSFLLDSSSQTSPFRDILYSIANTMDLPCDCMDFKVSISSPDGGFGLHFDRWDSIQFHLFGQKTWRIETNFNRDVPIHAEYWKDLHHSEPSDTSFENFSLVSGDTFFVPAGTWHKTQADTPSCTIILRIKNPLLFHLVASPDHSTEIERLSDLRKRTYGCWKDGLLDERTRNTLESIIEKNQLKNVKVGSSWPWKRSE